jgi:urea transport system ATP-binding protein
MLHVHGLNQYYGGSHTLRDVDLEVPAGACTALLGRNGAGKTTLLKCLMGVLPPASGSVIRLDGEDITRLPPHRHAHRGIAYVPQGRDIFPRLTVEENLHVAALACSGANGELQRELYELFPILRSMRQRRGGDLSGGQQQQLAIARALMARPRLLILDEPTEGIQPSIIKEIERVIRLLLARNLTILLVEQYYDFAQALADHYVVLARGEVVRRGIGPQMAEDEVRRYLAV